MPYIRPEHRKPYDSPLSVLLERLKKDGGSVPAGDLNYLISSLVWNLFRANKTYMTADILIGALECAKLEFYRRQVAPHEDKKILENGDV